MNADLLIWMIVALSVGGVIFRPFEWPEAVWAVGGAVVLVAAGLLPVGAAWRGVAQGGNVYLFLTGMMLLSELARREGLFDWLAARVVLRAGGSAEKLFLLIYAMGMVVTVFLSNDATAVVLTPAVAAVVRAAGAKRPLPFLLICAFVANAASVVLPISNPANLVIYAARLPPLLVWLPRYALASVVSITVTYFLLRLTQRAALRDAVGRHIETRALARGGWWAAAGIAGTAVVLMAASTYGVDLGLPALAAGLVTAALVLLPKREAPWALAKAISWGVLPLVAGLFVMVAAIDRTGVTAALADALRAAAGRAPGLTAWGTGLAVGFGSNLVNNLPAGLLAGHAVQAAGVSPRIAGAALVGIDLGPNLSVTGSLATILWLSALRREGLDVSAWRFLKIGVIVMPPALLLALAALFVTG